MCITTGMPWPLLYTESWFFSRLISMRSSVMLLSRCLLSAALTTISSKILYKPGTYEMLRLTILLLSASNTHMSVVTDSIEPTYVSGRCRMCWCCVSFW